MHKRRLNELKLHITIAPAGPILIKSGRESGADPALPSMNFVRTTHPHSGERVIYLPGASLKGVIRSHSERILRTVLGDDSAICCDPLDRNSHCGQRTKNIRETDRLYRALCFACRLFGHMTQSSHFLAADAYPEPASSVVMDTRYNVAIDRLSGGALPGALFDMEVALQGQFETTLTLFNFELWQVGLLALALRDLHEGRTRLGFAKSRGLGNVTVHYRQLEIAYPGQFFPERHDFAGALLGASALVDDDFARAYGYVPYDDRIPYPQTMAPDPDSLLWGRPAVRVGDGTPAGHHQVAAVLAAAVQSWAAFLDSDPVQRKGAETP